MKKVSLVVLAMFLVTMLFGSLPAFGAGIRDPYDSIDPRTLDGASHNNYATDSGCLGATGANSYFYFENVDFGTVSPTSVEIGIGAPAEYAGSTVEMRIDSAMGPLIASFVVQAGDWGSPILHTAEIATPVTGMHTLYLRTGSTTVNLYNFTFYKPMTGQDSYVDYSDATNFLDIADSPYKREINTLVDLGILEATGASYYYPNLFASRGDFAELVYALVNQGESEATGEVFADVPKDAAYAPAVEYLAKAGIVSGAGDGNYYPDEFITKRDALVLVSKALGYKAMAEAKGGYPFGYLEMATTEGLSEGLDLDGYLKNDEMALLMVNAIQANYYDTNSIEGDGTIGYVKVNGILTKTRNIYRGEGQVTTTNNTALSAPGSNLKFTQVVIGENTYLIGNTSAKSLLGYEVEYYYQDKNGEQTLLSIAPKKSVEVTKVSSENNTILDVNMSHISYLDENLDEQNITVASDVNVIYNGVAADDLLENLIEKLPLRGRVIYIENSTAKDVLFIEEYKNIQVEAVDLTGEVIKDKLSDTDSGRYSFNEDDNFFYCVKDGVGSTARKIKADDVAQVYQSKNKTGKQVVRMIASSNVVSGTISEIGEKIVIDGKEYTAAEELQTPLTVGFSGQFYVNAVNEIVVAKAQAGLLQTGLLLDYGMAGDSGSIDTSIEVKLVTPGNKIQIFTCASNILIDGNRMANSDNADILAKLDSIMSLRNTPVCYRLNAQNQLSMMDTYYNKSGVPADASVTSSDSNDLLTQMPTDTSKNLYWTSNTRLMLERDTGIGIIPLSTNCTVISMWANGDEDSISIGTTNDIGGDNISGKFYSFNPESGYGDIFLWSGRTSSDTSNMMLYDHSNRFVNDEGEECLRLYGYNEAKLVDYVVKLDIDSSVLEKINNLQKGHWISLSTNANNEVSAITLRYTDGTPESNATLHSENGYEGPGDQAYRYIYGTVDEKFDNFLKLSYMKSGAQKTEYVNVGNAAVMKVNDADGRTTIQTTLDAGSIMRGDKILVHITGRTVRQIIIVPNTTTN